MGEPASPSSSRGSALLAAARARVLPSLAVQAALLLLLHRFFCRVLVSEVPLPAQSYFEPVLVTQLFRSDGLRLLAAPLAAFLFLIFGPRLRARLPGSRAFATLLVALLGLAVVGTLVALSPLPVWMWGDLELVLDLLKSNSATLFVALSALLTLPKLKRLRWQDIDGSGKARWLILLAAALLAWTFLSYGENLYFRQSYDLDRALLLVTLAGLAIHPIALPAFLVVLMALAGQGHHPLPEGRWMWPDKVLPLFMLVMFQAFIIIKATFNKHTRPDLLVLCFLCLVGTTYGNAAVNKALLGPSLTTWLFENDLSNLFVSAHLHGRWLGDLSQETVVSIARQLSRLHILLALGSWLIEFAGFFLGMHWRFTRVAMVLFVALHLGIFATSGIFFWKWIVIDLALLAYVSRWRRDALNAATPLRIFTPRGWAVSLVLMLLGSVTFIDPGFAWFDTKLVNRFEIVGIGQSGQRYPINARFFTPYEMVFQQSRHAYSVDFPMMVGTYGTCHQWELTQELQVARAEDLPGLRERFGAPGSAAVDDILVVLVRRYLEEAERRGKPGWRQTIAPPFHFQTTPAPGSYNLQEPLAAFEIRYVETLHEGFEVTRDSRVVLVELQPSEGNRD